MGDPFFYSMYWCRRTEASTGNRRIEYRVFPVLQTLKPNKSQRTFEVELDPVG